MQELVDPILYRDVPAARVEQLKAFRASHPLQTRQAGGLEWSYLLSGQGEKTILLLGGGISTAESPFRLINLLEERSRVLSLNYPDVKNIGEMVDALPALLEAEGISQVSIFGHSLGGAAAHVLVRRSPKLVDKLVFSSFGLYLPRRVPALRRFINLLSWMPYFVIRSYYQPRMEAQVRSADVEERPFLNAYLEDLFSHYLNRRSLVSHFKLLGEFMEHMEAYDAYNPVILRDRVLILGAEDDTSFEVDEREALAAAYPGAKVHLFETAGHLVGHNRRDEYQKVLSDFLIGKLPPPAQS